MGLLPNLNNNCDLILNPDGMMRKSTRRSTKGTNSQNGAEFKVQHGVCDDFFGQESQLQLKVTFEPSGPMAQNQYIIYPPRHNLQGYLPCLKRETIANSPDISLVEKYSHFHIEQDGNIIENFAYFESEDCQKAHQLFSFSQSSFVGKHEGPQEHLDGQIPLEVVEPNILQGLEPSSQINDENESNMDNEANIVGKGNKITKNVTKNIGKLLFKFIWKNSKMLRQKLNIDTFRWDVFIGLIAKWKKQNNITRSFLINRWQNGLESSLFRTISRHFFRRRCIAAIFKSNIRKKMVHISRISRFSKAITDSSALDYIT